MKLLCLKCYRYTEKQNLSALFAHKYPDRGNVLVKLADKLPKE